jgi:FKBP-type peptidyl-prolyl cis-trans isomerase FkpA/FKBP-type peptidyl-prolyl cis-trans isomerase FklB
MMCSMRYLTISTLGLVLTGHAKAATPEADKNDVLYELGVEMSGVLQTLDLSTAEFQRVTQGLADGYRHRADLGKATGYDPQVQALRRARLAVIIEREKLAGEKYLQKAAGTHGASRLASGLVYLPIREGTGPMPTARDRVQINYVGRLIDGKVFDSSAAHGEPAILGLNLVMPCFSEALQLMKVGGKRRIVCPADLAYGDRGSLPEVLPGATLEFDIELLAVNPSGAGARSPLSTHSPDRD